MIDLMIIYENIAIIFGFVIFLSIFIFCLLLKRINNNKFFYKKCRGLLIAISIIFAIFIFLFLPILMSELDKKIGETPTNFNDSITQDLNTNLVNVSMSFYLAFLVFLIPMIIFFYSLNFKGKSIAGIYLFSLISYFFRNFLFAVMYKSSLGGLLFGIFIPNLIYPYFPLSVRQQIYNSFLIAGLFGFFIFIILSYFYKFFKSIEKTNKKTV